MGELMFVPLETYRVQLTINEKTGNASLKPLDVFKAKPEITELSAYKFPHVERCRGIMCHDEVRTIWGSSDDYYLGELVALKNYDGKYVGMEFALPDFYIHKCIKQTGFCRNTPTIWLGVESLKYDGLGSSVCTPELPRSIY
jgi:hypothetical protein